MSRQNDFAVESFVSDQDLEPRSLRSLANDEADRISRSARAPATLRYDLLKSLDENRVSLAGNKAAYTSHDKGTPGNPEFRRQSQRRFPVWGSEPLDINPGVDNGVILFGDAEVEERLSDGPRNRNVMHTAADILAPRENVPPLGESHPPGDDQSRAAFQHP